MLIANASAQDLEWLEKGRPYLDLLARTRGKLANPYFVDKAPAAVMVVVVEKERAKLTELATGIAKLEERRAQIAAM